MFRILNGLLKSFAANSRRKPLPSVIKHRAAAWLTLDALEAREVPAALAVWNFNDTNLLVDRIGTGVTGTPTLTTNFSSTTTFSGSTVNADSGDSAGQALALVGNANNGKSITFAMNTTGFADLNVTFATQRTSTGFNSDQVQYTTDGTTWINFGSAYNPATSFAKQTFDFSAIDALENNSKAGFRIIFNGNTSGSGNNRIDNFVIAGNVAATPPSVTSPTATAIASTTATLGGTVTADNGGSITERGVVYALTSANADPVIDGTGVTKVTSVGATAVFTANVSGLTATSGYSFKAYATNSSGTTYTAVSTFTTQTAVAPTITSPTSTLVTISGATLGGNVTADGFTAITERGVVYSKTAENSDPVIGAMNVTVVTATGTTGVFTAEITGLTGATGYSFKAYATNSAGTTYTSPASSFTTQSSALTPSLDMPTVTAISGTAATLGGTVTSDGGATITERGVVYSLTSANANPLIGGSSVTKVTAAGTTGVFTADITALASNSSYSFKAYATNSAGTSYSTPVSTFATATVPSVVAPTATAMTNTTAILGGTVASDGGQPILERGIVYSLTSENASPTLGGTGVLSFTTSGTTGVFTLFVNNLAATTGYSFKAYATNSVGTSYAPIATFTTLSTPTHFDLNTTQTAEVLLHGATGSDTVGNSSGLRVFSGMTSNAFFNVEGSGTGSFQRFAVADFLPVASPTTTSLGNVVLTLAEAPASFSAVGDVQIFVATVTDPNLIDVTANPNSGVPAAVAGSNGIAGIDTVFAPLATLLGEATYTLGMGLTVTLNLSNPAANALFLDAIQDGTRLRLIAVADPETPAVAFTGAGSGSTSFAPPKLSYDAFGPSGNPPTVTVDTAAVTVNEGATANNTGTVNDLDGIADVASVTASVGTVTYTPGMGTYAWLLNTTDGPANSATVTITATDVSGNTATTTFGLTVDNIAPTSTGVNGPSSIVEGSTGIYTLAGVTDVAGDLPTLRYSFGTSVSELAVNYTAATATNSFSYTPNDNGNATIYGMVYDKDGGINTYQIAVVATNSLPTAAGISGPTSLTASSAPNNYTLTSVADPSSVDFTTLRYGFALSAAGLAVDYASASPSNSFAQAFPAPGTYTVFARVYDKDGGIGSTQMLNVTATSGAANATGFTVNNGNTQRSRITTLTVSFDAPVTAADFNTLGAITLTRTAVSSLPTGAVNDVVQTGPAALNHITVTQGTAQSLVLTFDNNGSFTSVSNGVESGSLSDGFWKLTVGAFSSATNDLALRRLFGDSTVALNGLVDGADGIDFGNNFNSGSVAYDFNNDGVVDGSDGTAFGNRFGNVL